METASPGLVFGVHPFGVAGMANNVARGLPDDFTRLPGMIDELRGGKPLLLRTYIPYTGDDSVSTALLLVKMVTSSGAPWDAVLAFRFDGDDLNGWLQLIRQIVEQYGKSLHSLQITSESNLYGMPEAGDGCRPQVRRALREGILAARATARACGATVSIGFNAVLTFDASDGFWPAVRGFGDEFIASVDYVGLDFYPDVFGPPVPLADLPTAVTSILRKFRNTDLVIGGLPHSIPIRITENGWPTGTDRPDNRQAAVLESIIRTVHSLRVELNITHYELFGLRDADSSVDVSFFQFGIMRDDYTPKPAFEIYKKLVQELG